MAFVNLAVCYEEIEDIPRAMEASKNAEWLLTTFSSGSDEISKNIWRFWESMSMKYSATLKETAEIERILFSIFKNQMQNGLEESGSSELNSFSSNDEENSEDGSPLKREKKDLKKASSDFLKNKRLFLEEYESEYTRVLLRTQPVIPKTIQTPIGSSINPVFKSLNMIEEEEKEGKDQESPKMRVLVNESGAETEKTSKRGVLNPLDCSDSREKEGSHSKKSHRLLDNTTAGTTMMNETTLNAYKTMQNSMKESKDRIIFSPNSMNESMNMKSMGGRTVSTTTISKKPMKFTDEYTPKALTSSKCRMNEFILLDS